MSRYFDDEDEVRRASRRIAAEFEATYGSLEEKVSRVPDEAAAEIAQKYGVHIEIARVAYRILLDGTIPDAERCCSILQREFSRRKNQGNPVPDVASYIRGVAVKEGQWIEYLYSQLSKELYSENQDLENRYLAVRGEVEPANEHIMAVLAQRRKISEVFLKSIIRRWLNDHEGATIADAIFAIAGGLRQLGVDSISDIVNGARASILIKFRRYEKFLAKSTGSSLTSKVLETLRLVMNEVQKPIEQVSEITAEEILVEIIPPPQVSIDEKPKYGFIHPAFPTQPRVGPPLASPLDFLERDIWLALMQNPNARAKFLGERITMVVDNLLSEGVPIDQLGATIIFDLDQRLEWERSKRTVIRRELAEIRETGEAYRAQVEHYILEIILGKISQLRSAPSISEE